MKFTDKSFAVGQRGRSPSVCATNGHAEPDYRGKCFMCGERLQSPSQQMLDRAAREGLTIKEYSVTIESHAGSARCTRTSKGTCTMMNRRDLLKASGLGLFAAIVPKPIWAAVQRRIAPTPLKPVLMDVRTVPFPMGDNIMITAIGVGGLLQYFHPGMGITLRPGDRVEVRVIHKAAPPIMPEVYVEYEET